VYVFGTKLDVYLKTIKMFLNRINFVISTSIYAI
jgi:hypothetical protein